jgi:5-methylcytosine-specific restriction endonuclease McrBC GTP-binding regulatory subunit McrB
MNPKGAKMMKEVMTIFDVHSIPNKGIVIGGTNAALDNLSREQIRALIGKQVEIHSLKNIFSVDVIDIDVTNSLTGKKNIFILLPPKIQEDDIDEESVVFSGSHTETKFGMLQP